MSQPFTPSLSRRKLIKALTIMPLVSACSIRLLACPAYAAALPASSDFLDFSQFITGLSLSPLLAGRYYQALQANDPQFLQKLTAAISASASYRQQGLDAFLAATAPNSEVFTTLSTITSAWYLGVVGQGAKAVTIAWRDALMFRPTEQFVFVPTYGGGPNSWVSREHNPVNDHDNQDEQHA